MFCKKIKERYCPTVVWHAAWKVWRADFKLKEDKAHIGCTFFAHRENDKQEVLIAFNKWLIKMWNFKD